MSSSKKGTKLSSSSSLSKILSRISRTLSFSSKKSQQVLKKVKPVETVIKNVNFIPQSAPVIRRHQPQMNPKVIYIDNLKPTIYRNMYADNDIDEEEEDYSRYSLRPNLSLFNVSAENLNYHFLDDIFHSTKIDEY